MRSDALRTIFTADERFDDVRRARIWARLAPRLPTTNAAPRRWPWLVAAGALAAAAALAFVLRASPDGVVHVVPANGVLAMPLGPATHAALAGPGELLVVEVGERTAVQLHGGTLYGEFTGAPGRSLRIEANGAVIEIVGTLFSVTANAKITCVAVAHGRVKFTSRGVTTYVEGGQQSCAATAAAPSPTRPLDATTHDALGHFEHTWLATNEAAVPVPAPVVSPVVTPAEPHDVATPQPVNATRPTEPPAPKAVPAAKASPAPTLVPSPERAPAPESSARAPATSPAPAPAASPAPAPEAPPKPQAPLTADALYHAADEALARGDSAAADRAFADLLARDPDSALADEALYERARLAFARGDWSATRGFVAQLADHVSSALREPASYLGCRAALNAHDDDTQQCFEDYIAAFPNGPHVGDARAQLHRGTP